LPEPSGVKQPRACGCPQQLVLPIFGVDLDREWVQHRRDPSSPLLRLVLPELPPLGLVAAEVIATVMTPDEGQHVQQDEWGDERRQRYDGLHAAPLAGRVAHIRPILSWSARLREL
jgi:hypothetical protein